MLIRKRAFEFISFDERLPRCISVQAKPCVTSDTIDTGVRPNVPTSQRTIAQHENDDRYARRSRRGRKTPRK